MENNMTWPIKKLGDVATTISGTWGPPDNQGTAVIRSTNFTNDGVIYWNDVAYRSIPIDKVNQLALKKGDVLIEKSGGSPTQPVGRVVYFDQDREEKIVFGNFISKLKVRDEIIEPKFLFYYLLYFYRIGGANRYQNQTTGIRNLRLKDYLNIDIPKLGNSIQKKIVEKLDAIRKAQEINDAQISKTEELFNNLRSSFFPGSYKTLALINEIVDVFQYGISKAANTYGTGYPILRINSIKDGEIMEEDIKCVQLSKDEFRKYKLDKNDILFNRTNSFELVGKTGIFKLEGDFSFASYLIRLKTNEKVLPDFLNYILNSEFGQSEIKKRAKRAISQANVNAKELGLIEISLPKIEDQKVVVEKLSAVQDHKKLLLKQKSLFKELFDSVLDKSIKGEISL
jgi:type I restriction enzyme S subunit